MSARGSRGDGGRGRGRGRGRAARGRGRGQSRRHLDFTNTEQSSRDLTPNELYNKLTIEKKIEFQKKKKKEEQKMLQKKMSADNLKIFYQKRETKQVSTYLLPDAPPKKQNKRKTSPIRRECPLVEGTPTTPPPPKRTAWNNPPAEPWDGTRFQGFVSLDANIPRTHTTTTTATTTSLDANIPRTHTTTTTATTTTARTQTHTEMRVTLLTESSRSRIQDLVAEAPIFNEEEEENVCFIDLPSFHSTPSSVTTPRTAGSRNSIFSDITPTSSYSSIEKTLTPDNTTALDNTLIPETETTSPVLFESPKQPSRTVLEEATSPEGVKERDKPEREDGDVRRSLTPQSHTPPSPRDQDDRDYRDDIEHSIPATLIQDPNAERESPRCLSRDSSGAPRCPSNDSVYSGRSVGLPLPATLTAALPGALPAALLPPHSAAVAAYLGAAAVAAQQRLLQMSCQEDLTDTERAEAVLDFSRKRSESPQEEDDEDGVNLTKPSENGPLDLSVGTRKRGPEDSPSPVPNRKSSRTAEFKPAPSPWPSPVASHLPYFAAVAASLSPKGAIPAEWNGKLKHGAPTPNDATKALEKMSELSRLGGEELFRSVQSAALGAGLAPNAAARHSAWQSHWLNKGADQTKDVLKCVWCKKSFGSLADLTVHMKEAKHCGVNVPVPPVSGAPMPSSLQPPTSSPSTPSHHSSTSSSSSKPSQNELNMLIKENMPIPRKLVRGQDVWLGKGAEQTRQILKCMWCAESFRSLAEMTSHMQRTQHYTNIISQEQIISWKSSDEAKGSNSTSTGTNNAAPPPTGTSSHVSAVLTCKVCDQAFSSLKELSNHMVKNSHYKEHIMRSITESGGRRRQTREKRKKSLPVRKLLELERAQHEFKNGEGNGVSMGKQTRDFGAGSRITCEKCGDKIETAVFVEHIRQCIGTPMSNSHRNFLKSALLSNNIIPPDVPGHVTPTGRDSRKSVNDELPSPGSAHHRSPSSVNDCSPTSKDANAGNEKSSSPSVLNAIEQLIEKSFDTRPRHSVPGMPGVGSHAPIGSSILKRLGIDESVDYTKPLVDPQTMNMLRHYHQQGAYGRRERSGSESSSMSERGGSRVESLTPDRKLDMSYQMTPRTTPDTRRSQTPASEDRQSDVRIKKEVTEDDERENSGMDLSAQNVRVKTEVEEDEDPPRPNSNTNEDVKPTVPKRESEGPSPAPSPRSPASDRSVHTPSSERKPSSLGALSSMFDNLAGAGPSNEPSTSRRTRNSHPLAALQKLCDKTENHPSRAPPPAPSPAGPSSILTFSWACNDAVVTDSIMKCALCDTPFISKGAYRHHLSKMHFVKDGALPEPVIVKAPAPSGSPGTHKSGGSNAASPQDPRSPSQSFDESPHSKFLKYTELAKQLSSKYV